VDGTLDIAGVIMWDQFIANPDIANVEQSTRMLTKAECVVEPDGSCLSIVVTPNDDDDNFLGGGGDPFGGIVIVIVPVEPIEPLAKDPYDILDFMLKLPTSCLKAGEDCGGFGVRIQGQCYLERLGGLRTCELVGAAATVACSNGRVSACK
jgi:hypothetical protein